MAFWDMVAPVYDLTQLSYGTYEHMVDKVCELTPEGASVLELAGGTGKVSRAVCGKASEVLCTDISDNMLKIAERKAKKSGAANISFEKINVFDIRKPEGSFDVVIATQVFHIIDEAWKACAEIKHVTKNMAILVIPLLKEATFFGRILVNLFKILGFKPTNILDRNSCEHFLIEIGFNNCEYRIIEGTLPFYVAVWRRVS